MRRMVSFLLLIALVLPVLAFAQDELHWVSPTIGGNDAVMIVDNGDDWRTRLNLRAEQRKGSEIKGRIYTGTRVEIYQDNGEWCTVGLNFAGGHVLTGEVMKQYLTPLEDEFSALCPRAVAKMETEVTSGMDMTVAHLQPGDVAYVMAVCGDRYFVMVPGVGQGYAPVSSFEELTEPDEGERIIYRTLTVPAGGVSFADDYTGEEVKLAGGVQLDDCWQIPGDAEWNVMYGAGIQRTPRVRGKIPVGKLMAGKEIPFEGEVYDCAKQFIAVVGDVSGEKILRRTDESGDIYWSIGTLPNEAVLIEGEQCEIRGEAGELLSQVVADNVLAYVSERGVLDERGSGGIVTCEMAASYHMLAALTLQPGTGRLLSIRVWFEDEEGSYVTGGDLEPTTREIIRWGCNG